MYTGDGPVFSGVLCVCVCSGVSAAVQSPPPPQMKKKGVKDKEEVLLKLEVSLDLVSLSVTFHISEFGSFRQLRGAFDV